MQEERKVTAKTKAELNTIEEEKAKLPAPFDAEDKSPFIFVSYAHKDCKLVYSIISKLYEEGYYVWYDEGIEINSNYYDVIARHITESSTFLMFLSPNACASDFCIDDELYYAIAKKKQSQLLFCFLEENFELPPGVEMKIGVRNDLKFKEVTVNTLMNNPSLVLGEPPYKGKKRKAEGIKAPITDKKEAANKEGDEYTYENVNDGARLTEYNGKAEHVEIPASWKGYTVVELYETFYLNKTIKSVMIPGSVQSIGDLAFDGCSSLQSITIPGSVQSIGESAFSRCSSLQSITIPGSVQSIGDEAFYGCSSLQSITIPGSVQSIGDRAFFDCSSLQSITIPGSVQSIDYLAFDGCSSLTITCEENSYAHHYAEHIKIPFVLAELSHDTVPAAPAAKKTQKKENEPYVYCSYAPADKERVEPIIKGLESEGYRVKYGMSRRGSQEWANTLVGCKYVLSFISAAYVNSDELTDIQLSSQDKHILYWLEDCNAPEWLNIKRNSSQDFRSGSGTEKDNLARLKNYLKDNGCREEGIKDFNFSIIYGKGVTLTKYTGEDSNVVIKPEYFYGTPTISIGDEAFSGCSSLQSITIPGSVQSIGDGAFSGCSSLKSITIPGSVISIGGGAFDGCSSLKSITIPGSVQSIGKSAFSDCSSLKSITIPDSVESIGEWAFFGCSSLQSITIPDSVESIGEWAFSGCSSLKSITIPGGVQSIGNGAFDGCSRLQSIDVQSGNTKYTSIDGVLFSYTKDALIAFPGGRRGRYTIPNSVTSIGNRAFDGCGRLQSITIPGSVTSIGDGAFSGCGRLQSITIPGSVTSIGDGAFSDCSSLKSITIPGSVKSIGEWAFSGCSSLKSITIPGCVQNIGRSAFSRCSSLKSITIPGSVQSIGDGAFSDCGRLQSITIPGCVQSIGKWAFSRCKNLTVYCAEDSYAWQYCEKYKIPHKPLKKSIFSRIFGKKN